MPATLQFETHQVPLVVAKVNRLTRSVAFPSRLLEAGVDVRFADLPRGQRVNSYCSKWRPLPSSRLEWHQCWSDSAHASSP